MQHVGDGRKAAVEENIAGLRQRFLLQLNDVLEWQIAAGNRANQLQAFGLGEDQECASCDVPLET
jgi:hypothetical protein